MDTNIKQPSKSQRIEDLERKVELLERLLADHVHPLGYAALHRAGAEHDLVSVRDELANTR